jgi:hypothetical protein
LLSKCSTVVGSCWLRYGTLRQFSRKQCFIVPAQTQRIHVQSLSSENKGVSPYITLQAGYRSKEQGLIHIFNFIGYFMLMLLTFPSPQCYVAFFMFRFLRFYLSAMPSLPPCYFLRPSLFSSDPLPCYIIPPMML